MMVARVPCYCSVQMIMFLRFYEYNAYVMNLRIFRTVLSSETAVQISTFYGFSHLLFCPSDWNIAALLDSINTAREGGLEFVHMYTYVTVHIEKSDPSQGKISPRLLLDSLCCDAWSWMYYRGKSHCDMFDWWFRCTNSGTAFLHYCQHYHQGG